MQEALKLIGVNVSEFQTKIAKLAKDPIYEFKVRAAQHGKLNEKITLSSSATLDKAKTLTALRTYKTLSLKAIKSQKAKSNTSLDKKSKMIDILVEEAKLNDALFIEESVTNDQLDSSIMHYITKGDADIKKAMAAFMAEMKKE